MCSEILSAPLMSAVASYYFGAEIELDIRSKLVFDPVYKFLYFGLV